MEDTSSNVSYLNPRDPSIYLGKRLFEVKRTNLLSLFGDEVEEHTVSKNAKVKVYLRIKPTKNDTAPILAPPQDRSFEVKGSHTLLVRSLKDPMVHEFKFTKIFMGNTSQEKVYTECVHDLVKDFVNGQNCLLFAYGTSSAGKTYTVQGTSQEPGIIPRAINVLFNSIRGKESHSCRFKPDMVSRVVELDDKSVSQEISYKQQIMAWSQDKYNVFNSQISETSVDRRSDFTSTAIDRQCPDFVSNIFRDMQTQLSESSLVAIESEEVVFSIWVSFAEVYNENVYDLLEPMELKKQKRQNLVLGEDKKGQVYIKGLRHICVNSGDEAYQVMLYGQHNLKFAPTGLNSVSSRSHCIFTLKLLQHVRSEHPKFVRVSMFSFCDLAGSERAKHTQNVGERLRESQNINTSLLVLGRCLMTIRKNQMYKVKKLIPFRDSKLTRLFQRALNGKESLAMIVNVNPTPVLHDETFSVLMFSAIAKQISILPVRHKKRLPRSSRFSQYVSKNSTLSSNFTCEGDTTASSLTSNRDYQQLHSQIETLINKVGELKKQLALERSEKLALETEVRRELCDYFSNMMVEAQAEWESQLENTQQRYEQMGDWRLRKLEEYYEQQQTRKRHCADSSEDVDCILQDADTEVTCLTEKHHVANELLKASHKECHELSEKNSKLMFELSHCKSSLKYAERLKEAAQAACKDGDGSVLISEFESQLSKMKEELFEKQGRIKELEDILEDAKADCKQLEDDLEATEKERDALDLKLAEKESELGRSLDALSDKQHILDKQLHSLDEKDECIEILEKQLKELQEKYDGDMKTMTLKNEEQDKELKTLLKDNKSLKLFMADVLKKQEENNNKNEHNLQELENKLKESEDKVLQTQELVQIHQKKIQDLHFIKDSLENKLDALEKAEENSIKETISAQNSAEEYRKKLEESTSLSQKEITKLKVQLQTCMDNAEFVRSLKEELESKSLKYKQLENENESLKRSLDIKEKIRKLKDYLTERDLELKTCYVKLHKLEEISNKSEYQDVTQNSEMQAAVPCHSQVSRRQRSNQTRKKAVDENSHPNLASLEKKPTSRIQSDSVGKKQGCSNSSKSRSRRKNLFSCNLDETSEFTPVETEEIPRSLSPRRLLRSRRV
ncbi:kinesin-like protein KIF20A isoform X2 [Zootermopsis nevadensis]|uniref:kinesin-like protein KIF20A isoform X2 n=1 Tax=Zootermopsis nevadensis TaxID=136037 RepID=UPI000B8E446A|nr:kinesin-like protein KIF20A isoform X2 [Zootermopsis nevadensis]